MPQYPPTPKGWEPIGPPQGTGWEPIGPSSSAQAAAAPPYATRPPNLMRLPSGDLVDADDYSKRLTQMLGDESTWGKLSEGFARIFGKEGLTSRVRESMVSGAVGTTEKVFDFFEPKPSADIAAFTEKFPTLGPILYATSTVPYNIWKDVHKNVVGIVADPFNWPFLISGIGAVRPVIHLASNLLFTGLQGKEAYNSLKQTAEAVRTDDWQAAVDSGAASLINTGFSMLGLAGIPSQLKGTIITGAWDIAKTSRTERAERVSAAADIEVLPKDSKAGEVVVTPIPETPIPETPIPEAKVVEAGEPRLRGPKPPVSSLEQPPPYPASPSLAETQGPEAAPHARVPKHPLPNVKAEEPPAEVFSHMPYDVLKRYADYGVLGAAAEVSRRMRAGQLEPIRPAPTTAEVSPIGPPTSPADVTARGGQWNPAKQHYTFPDNSSGYFTNLGEWQPTTIEGRITTVVSPPEPSAAEGTIIAGATDRAFIGPVAPAAPVAPAMSPELTKWLQFSDQMGMTDGIRADLNGGRSYQETAASLKERFPFLHVGDATRIVNAVDTAYHAQRVGISMERTSEGKLKLGADPRSLGTILGSSLYGERGGGIVAKELLQNAFDAVRPHPPGKGSINVTVDYRDATFSIRDNGMGMTPEEVYTVFSDLGSSGKRGLESASGGFGLAKAAPLMIAEWLDVQTVAVDPATGRRVMTSFRSTPDSILDGTVDVSVKFVANSTPTGTSITAKVDKDGMYEVQNFAGKSILSVSPPAEVTGKIHYDDMSSSDIITSIEPLYKDSKGNLIRFDKIIARGIRSSFGFIDIYGTNIKVPGLLDFIDIEVNNNGIFQFNGSINAPSGVRGIPKRIAVDMRSNVPEGNPRYPFTANRESLSSSAYDELKAAIIRKIINPAIGETMELLAKTYRELPSIHTEYGDAPILDSGRRLTSEEFTAITASKPVIDIATAIQRVALDVVNRLKEAVRVTDAGTVIDPVGGRIYSNEGPIGSRIERFGLVLSSDVHGVYIPNPSTVKNTKPPASVLINPFSFKAAEYKGPLGPGNVAAIVWHTIKHEILHDLYSGHTASFTTAEAHLARALGSFEREASRYLEAVYADPTNPGRIRPDLDEPLRIYEESRGRPESSPDILRGEESAAEREQPLSGPEGEAAARLRTGRGEAVREGGDTPRGEGTARELQPGEATRGAEGAGPIVSGETVRHVREASTHLSASDIKQLNSLGININLPVIDLGFIARYVGSITQQLRRVSPIAGRVADILVDSANAIAKGTFDSLVIYRRVLNANFDSWDLLVTMLDDPSVTPQSRPANVPDKLWDGYLKLRGLLDYHRITMIDARRRADIANGYTAAQAVQRTPDTWGIGAGYIPHAQIGNWTVRKQALDPITGQLRLEPIETGYRHVTLQEAIDKAVEYAQANPNSAIELGLDAFSLPGTKGATAAKLRLLGEKIRTESADLANQQLQDLIQGMHGIRDLSGALIHGPQRIARRQFGHALRRESNLPGWLRTPEAFETYIRGTERYIQLVEARPRLLRLRNYLANERNIASAQSVVDLPSRSSSYLIARLDGAIEALEGYPSRFMTETRGYLERRGWNPELVDKAMSFATDVEAVLKLGYSPVSALTNLTQTLTNTYPVLGETYTLKGLRGYADLLINGQQSRYYALAHEIGIEAQVSKLDVDNFFDMRNEIALSYKLSGRGIKGAAAGAVAGVRDLGLFMFVEAESLNRHVAAIGAYEKARQQFGLSHEDALNYARDVVNRTQFVFHRFDKPAVLAALPAPIGQFKSFVIKEIEFITGLRGMEIPRFFAAVAATGIVGLPGLKALDDLLKWSTGYSFLNELVKNPTLFKVSRGIPGLMGADITQNVGFSEWFGSGMFDPKRLAGPSVSDLIEFIAAKGSPVTDIPGLSLIAPHPSSRSTESARIRFWRGLSPELRRTVEMAARREGPEGKILIDPISGDVILPDLTTGEHLAMGIFGITPLRIAQERELNRMRGELVERRGDIRGFYLDRLAEVINVSSEASLSPKERQRLDSLTQVIIENAGKDGILDPSFVRALQERTKRMVIPRSLRDVLQAPLPIRPEQLKLNEQQIRP